MKMRFLDKELLFLALVEAAQVEAVVDPTFLLVLFK
jgi:hypothetical protein